MTCSQLSTLSAERLTTLTLACGLVLTTLGCNSDPATERTEIETTEIVSEQVPSADEATKSATPTADAKEHKVKKVEYTPNPLVGTWERQTAPWKGMKIRVEKTRRGFAAFVVKPSPTPHPWYPDFESGELKWKGVVQESYDLFTLYDLGSDGLYLDSHIRLNGDRLTLRCSGRYNEDGGLQEWKKVSY